MPTLTSNTGPGRILRYVETLCGQQAAETYRACAARYFQIDPASTHLLLRVIEVFSEIDKASSDLSKIPGVDKDLYTNVFEQVKSSLAIVRLDHQIETFQREVKNSNLITLLKFCDSTFIQHGIIDGVIPSEVKSWHEDLVRISAEIAEANDLSEEIRDILIQLTEALRLSLLRVRVGGAEALRSELEIFMVAGGIEVPNLWQVASKS